MSLDVYLEKVQPTEVFEANITHNLGTMAQEAGLYDVLWHPERLGLAQITGKELVQHLQKGLDVLRSDPTRFRIHNPPNGWGNYEGLVRFVERYLEACRENPDATVRVSR